MSQASIDASLEVLLQWINLMPPGGPPSGIEELSDGFRIWSILCHIGPEYFSGDLPETEETSSRWVWRWQNLKHIGRALDRCAVSSGQRIPHGLDAGSIDLKSVSGGEDTSFPEMLKLLKLFIFVASTCSAAANGITVGALQQLGPDAQSSIMHIVREMAEGPNSESEPSDPDPSTKTVHGAEPPDMDQALLYEQRLGKVTAERDALLVERLELRKDLRDYDNRHSRLQENNEILQQRLIAVEDQLKKGQDRGSEESVIRRLEVRLQDQDNLIAGHEAQLNDNQERLESMSKETSRLRKENERIQPLQDELDEIKAQRDAFAKKANMADKYQQKLQDYAELEKENQILRGELEEARFEKGDGSNARTQIAGLQKTIEESRVLVSTIEVHRHELQGMLKQLELDNEDLRQERDAIKDQLAKTQEQISEMRVGGPPSPPAGGEGPGLASEMEDSERRALLDAMPAEERSKKLFKDLEETRAELFMHKQISEDRQNRYAELEKRYEELNAEKITLERLSAKTAAISDVTGASNPADEDSQNNGAEGGEQPDLSLTAEIAKLRERIKLMETQDPSLRKAADAALMKQEVRVLRQENRLMSTAWFDLNVRAQLNNVILQRKHEAPRGFLKMAREVSERAMTVKAR